MNILQPLFRLLFSFKGRINRKTFWACVIPSIIMTNVIIGLRESFVKHGGVVPYSSEYELISWTVISLLGAIFVINVCFTIKRLHDTGQPSYVIWVLLIPLIGYVYILVVCGFFKGTDGDNDYGPPPG